MSCFHRVIKYGLLTARYGPRIVLAHDWSNDDTPRRRPMDPTARIRPMDGTAHRRPIVSTTHMRPVNHTASRRPMDRTARRRPMDPKARIEGRWILRPDEGPWIIRPAGGPWLQQFVCCHDYFGLVTKNRLLWPLKKQKKNCSDYKQTTKQDNKEINKQSINASLLPLLHITSTWHQSSPPVQI